MHTIALLIATRFEIIKVYHALTAYRIPLPDHSSFMCPLNIKRAVILLILDDHVNTQSSMISHEGDLNPLHLFAHPSPF
jgi:hypothetical protein